MGRITGWFALFALAGSMHNAFAQDVQAGPVHLAAEKFAPGITWRESAVLTSDFTCADQVQFAILGSSPKEVVVAIFIKGLDQAPELLRFDAAGRNLQATKIRLDDYSLTADEIAGVSGTPPVGYRPFTTCHGVRLSDDRYDAAHIYWDHEHQRFDSWAQ
jgi:hypothetical protein